MNQQDVDQILQAMTREVDGRGRREWRDSRHLLIHGDRLSRTLAVPGIGVEDDDPGAIIALEIELNDPEPVLEYDGAGGVRAIDGAGLWCHDGDGHIDGSLFRSILVPWHRVRRLTVHRST